MDLLLSSAGRFGDLLEALKVPVFREVQPRLEFELRRARRYEHPLSVIVLGAHGEDLGDDRFTGAGNGRRGASPLRSPRDREPVHYLLLGSYLRNNLRETDLLASVPERLVYTAFLPETDEQGSFLALGRLARGLSQCATFGMKAGVAEFPRDALTVKDLFERASEARDRPEPKQLPSVEMEKSHA